MKIVCAWCREDMGEKEGPPDLVTHTICNECRAFVGTTGDGNLLKYITANRNPIVMVDGEGKVMGANAAAIRFLNKSLPEISGMPGGDAFNCVHALLPEGCGNTKHCYACTVRRAVQSTHKTGEPAEKVPVDLNLCENGRTVPKHLVVSTCLSGGIVYLRIESEQQQ